MVKRNFSLIAVTAAVALAGCGGDDDGSQRKKGDFVIGNAAPLSGDLQDLGRASQKSADLALQEIRNSIATAGLRGSVSLESADTGSEPGQSVDAIRDLANKGAKCITGPWGPTAVAQAARSVVAEKRLLTISPAATADFIGTRPRRGDSQRARVRLARREGQDHQHLRAR